MLWRRESSHRNKDGEKKTYYHWACSSKFAKGDIACEGTSTTTVAIRNVYKELTDGIEVDRKALRNYFVTWLTQLKNSLSDTANNAKIEKELERLEGQRSKLLEAYLEEIISKEDYKSKYNEIGIKIAEKEKMLTPVEDNEDVKEIERILSNLDEELDTFVKTLDTEDNKIDFLIEHTKKITVLDNKDLIVELDLVAGAIIAGKDFLLYVHDSMALTVPEVTEAAVLSE